MTKIYILRHGNTFDPGDIPTRVGARTDLALSKSGQVQAESLAQHFRTQGICFERCLCSPLLRTRQTAQAVLAHPHPPLKIQIETFLREIDYGPDENQPEEMVIARIGEAALRAWDEEAIAPSGWVIDPKSITESWKRLFEKAKSFQDQNILIVTSNGIARFALYALEGKKPITPLKLKTASYGIISCTNTHPPQLEGWQIRP